MAAIPREASLHVEPRDPPEHLADLIRADARAHFARRLTAVRLAELGQTALQVAGRVPLSGRRVRARVAQDNTGVVPRHPEGGWWKVEGVRHEWH